MCFSAMHRTINCMVGQMKHILATEQKKTDFRPEDENNVMIQYTTVREARPQLLPLSTHAKQTKSATCISLTSVRVIVLRINKGGFWIAFVSRLFCLHVFPCFPVCLLLLQACSKVCAYVSRQVEHVRKSMDGKNVDTVLTELGVRFHRLIHEHLQQYSYSSMGGMLAICDVAEYRRCAKDFRVSRRGQRSRILWSQGKTWPVQQRLYLCLSLHKLAWSVQVNIGNFVCSVQKKMQLRILFMID